MLENSKIPGMHEILAQHNLRWAGHLNRLENSRLLKQILREGSLKTGRLKLRHKDIIKRNMGVRNIALDNWQYLSKNRKTGVKNQRDIIIGYDEQLVLLSTPLFILSFL